LNVALLDTTVPARPHGRLSPEQIDWVDALAASSTQPVLAMGHHPPWFEHSGDDPAFLLAPASSAALLATIERRRSIVAYAAGHTHRTLVRRTGADAVPCIEVGCVKDFPGVWAEYQVYDGGVLQILHRISSPEALAWSEECRGLYADFGVDYSTYALGRLDDRCFPVRYRH
jgi:3',5'-cyclic AMP phosphodiesterase CpdA